MTTLTHLHRLADRALGAVVLLERTRDPAGQFAPQQPPGMDAMTMRTAYNQKHNAQRQSTAARVAKVAAIGAGLVGAGMIGKRIGIGRGVNAVNRLRKRASAGRSSRANVRQQPGFGEHLAKKIDDANAARRSRPAQ